MVRPGMEGPGGGAPRGMGGAEQLIVALGQVPVEFGARWSRQLQVEVQVPVQSVGIVVDALPLHVPATQTPRRLTGSPRRLTVVMATASTADSATADHRSSLFPQVLSS